MNGRRILAAVFLLLALGAGYLTALVWREGESSKWLFLVFTVFFAALTLAPLVPEFKRKPEPAPQTRFVSHGFMMLALGVVVLVILAAIVGAVLGR